ncbi:MAG: hypothetical protein KC766_16550 [Myxococcales bacterium]|nr:hypothetical protein [Myxococcales bacterium]
MGRRATPAGPAPPPEPSSRLERVHPLSALALLIGCIGLAACDRTPSVGATPAASVAPSTSAEADEGELEAAADPKEQLDPAVWRPNPAASPGDGEPAKDASVEDLRAFIAAHPKHPNLEQLEVRHDALLAPCLVSELPPAQSWPHRVASCNPQQVLVAEGMLGRAERYLAECIRCKDEFMVKALRTRMRSTAPTARREAALHRLEVGLFNRDIDAAQQAIADHVYLGKPFLDYARRKLKRRFKPDQLDGDLGDPSCSNPVPDGGGTRVFFSPEQPVGGEAFRVIAVSETPRRGASLGLVRAGGGEVKLEPAQSGGGPPYYWVAKATLDSGSYRVRLQGGDEAPLCQRFAVKRRSAPRPRTDGEVWPTRRSWDRDYENLYSVWIATLFDAPEATTWHGFHSVTRQAQRNILFDHLGLAEDSGSGPNALTMTPDCADGPHFFRAYFAWKLSLPFGYHRCRFGSVTGAPKCADWTTNEGVAPEPEEASESKATARQRSPEEDAGASPEPRDARAGDATAPGEDPRQPRKVPFVRLTEPRDPPVREMTRFLALVKNEINARSLRTDFADSVTDLYPVPLTRDALRPGTVYSDPYGHTYTLVKWQPQTKDHAGVLLAVDAQPDETINIKRFWRGNFLFSPLGKIDGHGFKAFRPIVVQEGHDGEPDRLDLLSNWQIAVARGYANYSAEQESFDAPGFYGRMERLINPDPLSPVLAYKELHRALHRQLRQRVKEIDLAQEYLRRNPGETIEMPRGQAIFRTTGPWEALSTPCRDLRLLVGIDALRDFPEQVIRVAPQPEVLRKHLARLHDEWSRERHIRYTKSDGSVQDLSLLEVLQRETNLELGWNPNDCPERRWGAPSGSEELKSCKSQAPDEQRGRMEAFRHWFAHRYSCG